jgi:hypothetical protein
MRALLLEELLPSLVIVIIIVWGAMQYIENHQNSNTKITQEIFQNAVVGKTPDQVLAAVGKPDDIFKIELFEYWSYKDRTIDRLGAIDSKALVVFKNGVVERVQFY